MEKNILISDIRELYNFDLLGDDKCPISLPIRFYFNCAQDQKSEKELKEYFYNNYLKEVLRLYPHYGSADFNLIHVFLKVNDKNEEEYRILAENLLNALCHLLTGHAFVEDQINDREKLKNMFVSELEEHISRLKNAKRAFFYDKSEHRLKEYDTDLMTYLNKKYKVCSEIAEEKNIEFPRTLQKFIDLQIEDCQKAINRIDRILDAVEKPVDMNFIYERIDLDELAIGIAKYFYEFLNKFGLVYTTEFSLYYLGKYAEKVRNCKNSTYHSKTTLFPDDNQQLRHWNGKKFVKKYEEMLRKEPSYSVWTDRLMGKTTFASFYHKLEDFFLKTPEGYVPFIMPFIQFDFIVNPLLKKELAIYLNKNYLDKMFENAEFCKENIFSELKFTFVNIDGKDQVTLNSVSMLEAIFCVFTKKSVVFPFTDKNFQLTDKEGLKKDFTDNIMEFEALLLQVSDQGNIELLKENYSELYDEVLKQEDKMAYIANIIIEIKRVVSNLDTIIELADKPVDLDFINSTLDLDCAALLFTLDIVYMFEYNLKSIEKHPETEREVEAHIYFINNWYRNVVELRKQNPDFNPNIDFIDVNKGKVYATLDTMIEAYKKIAKKYPEYFNDHFEEEKEEIKEEPKSKYNPADEKLTINDFINGLGDFYLTEIIVKNKRGNFIRIDELDKHSKDNKLLFYIKNNYFLDILDKVREVPETILSDIELVGSVDEQLKVTFNISFESVLKALNMYITGEELTTDGCRTLEDLKNKFIDSITSFGDIIVNAIDGGATQEDEELLQQRLTSVNAKRIYNLPYSYRDYLNKTLDLILNLCDSFDYIKDACNKPITSEEIDKLINSDTYYLEQASKQFSEFKNNITSGNNVKKEEYLMLAKYLNAIKRIRDKKNYDVTISSNDEQLSASSLLSEYERLIANNDIYDLETSPLYSVLTNQKKTKTLIANWNILPKGHIKRLKDTKLSDRLIPKNKKDSSFSEDYAAAIKRKMYLDGTDCIIIDGANSFKGYRGYYYSTGLVLFEMFFEDETELIPAKDNATYVMNVDNFVEMSALTKPEVMEYIKSGNDDVRRLYHTPTWEGRVMDVIMGKKYSEITKNLINRRIDESLARKKELKHE